MGDIDSLRDQFRTEVGRIISLLEALKTDSADQTQHTIFRIQAGESNIRNIAAKAAELDPTVGAKWLASLEQRQHILCSAIEERLSADRKQAEREAVLLSDDLAPRIFAFLPLASHRMKGLCVAWRRAWKETLSARPPPPPFWLTGEGKYVGDPSKTMLREYDGSKTMLYYGGFVGPLPRPR